MRQYGEGYRLEFLDADGRVDLQLTGRTAAEVYDKVRRVAVEGYRQAEGPVDSPTRVPNAGVEPSGLRGEGHPAEPTPITIRGVTQDGLDGQEEGHHTTPYSVTNQADPQDGLDGDKVNREGDFVKGDGEARQSVRHAVRAGEVFAGRAMDDGEAERGLRRAFAGAKVERLAGREVRGFSVELPDGRKFAVLLTDEIPVNRERFMATYGRDLEAGDVAAGAWFSGLHVMQLAKIAEIEDLDHESWHAAKELAVLTAREQAALEQAFGGDEEAEARAYAAWAGKPSGVLGRMYARVRRFFRKLAGALGLEMRDGWRDAFEAVRYGEVWRRDGEADATGEGEKYGMKEGGQMRYARGSTMARQAAKEFVGKELTNRKSGMTATVSGVSLEKMLSKSAWSRSASVQAHMMAVANLDHLFERAEPEQVRDPKEGTAGSIKRIAHFSAPFEIDGVELEARILVKQFKRSEDGNRIYLVSSVEIEKPASYGMPPTSPEATPVNIPPAGFDSKMPSGGDVVKGDGENRDSDKGDGWYSVKSAKREAEGDKGWLRSLGEAWDLVAGAAKKPKRLAALLGDTEGTGRRDLGALDTLVMTPSHYADTFPAFRKMYDAARDGVSLKWELRNRLFGNAKTQDDDLEWLQKLEREDGKTKAVILSALQWGRARLGTDGENDTGNNADEEPASMGPCPVGHGWNTHPSECLAKGAASMGPCPVGHGWPPQSQPKESQTCRFNGAVPGWARMGFAPASRPESRTWLQWGRARLGTDGVPLAAETYQLAVLQWGRARLGTDGSRSARPREAQAGFNGAVPGWARMDRRGPGRRNPLGTRFNGAVPGWARMVPRRV